MTLDDRQKKIAKLKDSGDLLLFKEIERLDREIEKTKQSVPDFKVLLESVRGKDGDRGPKGEKGDAGYTPIKGVDYIDGKDGYTPVKGVDYFDGATQDVDYDQIFALLDDSVEDTKKELIASINDRFSAEMPDFMEMVQEAMPDVPDSILSLSDTPDEYKADHLLISTEKGFDYIHRDAFTKIFQGGGGGGSSSGGGDSLWTDSGTNDAYIENYDVGIGTSAPRATLDIKSSGDPITDLSDENLYQIRIQRDSNTAGGGPGIAFTSSTDSVGEIGAAIVHERTGGNSQGKLNFYTKQSTSSAVDPELAMTINESGYVGIGIDNPSVISHTYSATENVQSRLNTDKVNGSATYQFGNDAGEWAFGINPSNQFVLGPAYNLAQQIFKANNSGCFILGTKNATLIPDNDYSLITVGDSDTSVDWSFEARSLTGTPLLSVRNDGNVGIGTDTPSNLLHLAQTADSEGLNIQGFDDVSNASVRMYLTSNGDAEILASKDITLDADELKFDITNVGNSMIIKGATGNVGIGTTTPDSKLEIEATTATDIGLAIKASASQTANLFEVRDDADTILNVIDADGNVGIGEPNPAEKLHITDSTDGTVKLLVENSYNISGNDNALAALELYSANAFRNDDEDFARITFSAGASRTSVAEIRATTENTSENEGNIEFWTKDSGGLTQAMKIGNNGRVLLGPAGTYAPDPLSILDIRGADSTTDPRGGSLMLSTNESSIIAGNKLGQIDFRAPDEFNGSPDGRDTGASIWAEATATFTSTVNSTDLVFATAESEAAVEKMRLSQEGYLGIGTNAPSSLLHVKDNVDGRIHIEAGPSGGTINSGSRLVIEDNTACKFEFLTPNTFTQTINFSDPDGVSGLISYSHASDNFSIISAGDITFRAIGSDRVTYSSTGAVYNPSGSTANDFRVESGSNTHMFFLDAGTDEIGINTSTPTSTFDINGSFGTKVTEVTTTTHTAADEHVILVDDDTAGAEVTVTLPAISGKTGRQYVIGKVGNTANVIIDGNASETINGQTTFSLIAQWESVKVTAYSGGWFVTEA